MDMGTPPGVCPMAFWVMLQSIMGYGYPPCGQTHGWMDRHVSKHYLPVVLRTRAVTISQPHFMQTITSIPVDFGANVLFKIFKGFLSRGRCTWSSYGSFLSSSGAAWCSCLVPFFFLLNSWCDRATAVRHRTSSPSPRTSSPGSRTAEEDYVK